MTHPAAGCQRPQCHDHDALIPRELPVTPSDLLVAAALVEVHGRPHLRPLADRLTDAAARITPPLTTEDADG